MLNVWNLIKKNYYLIFGIIFVISMITFYSTFSLDNDVEKFESLVYEIDDRFIKNISPYTNVELFEKYFDIDNCYIEVVDMDDKKLEKSDYVFNGSKTIIYDYDNNVINTYINIIKGDFTSDGIVDNSDYEKMGMCLVDNCSLKVSELLSVDIDDDGELHINDISLLDKTISSGYEKVTIKTNDIILQTNEVGRVVATITPSYGLNQNLKWSSGNKDIVTVDDAGRVTGHNEGEAIIKAMTSDGKVFSDVVVKVDNTIQLYSYQGVGYIGGDDLRVKIKAIDYDGLECSSSNEDIATCKIEDKYLVMRSVGQGNTEITVSSTKYGSVKYKLNVYSVYLNVMPRYLCVRPNSSNAITVSSFNGGELSFKYSDPEIIKNAYMTDVSGRKMLRIDFGPKQGSGTLTVKELNGNSINEVVVDVTSISIPQIGSMAVVGEDVATQIAGDNFGELSCKSEDDSKATCSIDKEAKQLIVTPLSVGEVNITVYNKISYEETVYNCGEAQFLVVIRE